MKLALHKPLFRHQYQMEYRYYLGFGYLKAHLERHLPEVDVAIVDSEEELRLANPDVIGFSTVSEMYTHVLGMHRRVRDWFAGPILFGGPHITAVPQTLPNDARTIAVIGEGEIALQLLLERMLKKDNGLRMGGPSPGTAMWMGSKLAYGPAVPFVDINTLPLPVNAPTKIFPFTTVRGCPYRCTHCVEGWTQGTKVRILDAEKLADICIERYEQFGTTVFELLDDLFLVSAPRIFQLVDILDKRGVIERFEFIRLSLMAHMITDEVAKALSRLNVRMAGMGVESADPEILKRFKSGVITRHHIEEAIRNCTRYGVGIGASMVLGYPGETEQQMRRTIDFYADRITTTSFEFWENYVCQPLPGSTLWKGALEAGKVASDMDFSTLRIDADVEHFDSDWHYDNEDHLPRERFLEILTEYDLVRDGHYVRDKTTIAGEPKTDVFVNTYVPPNVARRMTTQTLRAWANEDGGPVAVFGAGRHTRKILPALLDSPVKIACIADDNIDLRSQRIGRWNTVTTEDMQNMPDVRAILVSSDMRHEELTQRLIPLATGRYSLLTIYQPEELSRRRNDAITMDAESVSNPPLAAVT